MKQKEIILIPFPFSDQTGTKVRPALILSNNQFNESSEDILVCAITTNMKKNEYTIIIKQEDVENGILYADSAIKTETIIKIDKKLIMKRIGSVHDKIFSQVIEKIIKFMQSE